VIRLNLQEANRERNPRKLTALTTLTDTRFPKGSSSARLFR